MPECFGIIWALCILFLFAIISWLLIPSSLQGPLGLIVNISVLAIVLDYYFGKAIFGRHFVCV